MVSKSKDYGSLTKKTPVAAFWLSFLYPGLGQLYNHQPEKGIIMIAGYSACIALTIIGLETSEEIAVAIASGIGGGIFIWSIIDAPTSASAINKKEGLTHNNLFENDKFGLNIKPHSNFTFVNTGNSTIKPQPTFGAKLTINIIK